MAIIVKYEANRKNYVFLGASYSFFKDSRPSFLGGTLFPHQESGGVELGAVCDKNGEIKWIPTAELRVVEVDGVKVEDVLGNINEKGE